jgi:hypothetical protein
MKRRIGPAASRIPKRVVGQGEKPPGEGDSSDLGPAAVFNAGGEATQRGISDMRRRFDHDPA